MRESLHIFAGSKTWILIFKVALYKLKRIKLKLQLRSSLQAPLCLQSVFIHQRSSPTAELMTPCYRGRLGEFTQWSFYLTTREMEKWANGKIPDHSEWKTGPSSSKRPNCSELRKKPFQCLKKQVFLFSQRSNLNPVTASLIFYPR